jgi:glycine oxidase
VNVIVVGAGVIGCAVAHELSLRGATVAVVDARAIGQGATQASAGMLAPYIEGHIPALMTLGLHSLDLYDGFVARLRAGTSSPVEYGRQGSLQVARGETDLPHLHETAAFMDASGGQYAWLDADQVRELEPGLAADVSRGLLIPAHGYVRAGLMTAALADAARARGVRFSSGRVEDIDERDAVVRVTTTDGVLEADRVVLAAGSWSPTTPALVKPVRGQLLHLDVPQSPASRVIWHGHTYLVPWLDGSLLVGATVEDVGFDERATVEGAAQLRASAERVLPALSSATVREVRVGLRPHTPDELPLIGPSSTMPGVFYATGHYRSGVLLAPLTALMVAGFLLDGRRHPDLELTRPDRFGL